MLIPSELGKAIACLHQAGFDLLYYWEAGTDSLSYFLPFCRLARVQCAGWGWPDTTGIANMDYFVSMAGVETPASDQDYSERLIRLPHLTTCYTRPPVPTEFMPRAHFALPAQAHWYLCNQNVRKIHPDYDALATEVLRRDPQGILVITGYRHKGFNALLLRRLRALHPDVAGRIHLLPNLPEAEYLSLVARSEVILDTLHYSGGANTTFDAFACGTPIITLPGQFHRGRFTAAAYRQIGLSECIAGDQEDYIRLAVKLGTDGVSRRRLSVAILEASADLFDDPRPVAELEACLIALCQA
jgi:predicted O-linked N-acetylglucosamine transferase (SPINDLY family)